MCVCVCVCVCVCMCVCKCVYVCVYVRCMYVCMYVCVYILLFSVGENTSCIPSVSYNEHPYDHHHIEPAVLIVTQCMTKYVQYEVLKIVVRNYTITQYRRSALNRKHVNIHITQLYCAHYLVTHLHLHSHFILFNLHHITHIL